WSPINSVFSIELDGISNACSAKVMMNSPVTITMAMEAMNSGVVSFDFSGFSAVGARWAFGGAVLNEFLVGAKCVVPKKRSLVLVRVSCNDLPGLTSRGVLFHPSGSSLSSYQPQRPSPRTSCAPAKGLLHLRLQRQLGKLLNLSQ